MGDSQFCTACGKEFDHPPPYCPACGSPVNSPSGPSGGQTVSAYASIEKKNAEDKFEQSMMLLFLGAAVSLLMGALFVSASGMDPQEVLKEALRIDKTITLADVEDSMKLLSTWGYPIIACGIACAVAGVLVYLRKIWTITFIFAVIATALGVSTIIGVIPGAVVCGYLYKYKDHFETAQKNNL